MSRKASGQGRRGERSSGTLYTDCGVKSEAWGCPALREIVVLLVLLVSFSFFNMAPRNLRGHVTPLCGQQLYFSCQAG